MKELLLIILHNAVVVLVFIVCAKKRPNNSTPTEAQSTNKQTSEGLKPFSTTPTASRNVSPAVCQPSTPQAARNPFGRSFRKEKKEDTSILTAQTHKKLDPHQRSRQRQVKQSSCGVKGSFDVTQRNTEETPMEPSHVNNKKKTRTASKKQPDSNPNKNAMEDDEDDDTMKVTTIFAPSPIDMKQLVFMFAVSVALRLEYLFAAAVVAHKQRDWSNNKRRLFTVRVVSFTHALISALGCLTSLLLDFNYVREPYDYHTKSAQYVFLFSMGYFIYDLVDMYIHDEAKSSKEYLIHHSLVIVAFSIILTSGKLFGLAMIGLLVEVQTIFLHLRTMIRLAYGSKKQSPAIDLLINANMTCLFLFRHLPVCYLLSFLLFQDDKVPFLLKTFLVGGLTFLEYHNTHLTVAMAKADGFFGNERQILDEDSCDPLGSLKKEKAQ
ncbi:unnamed protein product [Caenorhabditis auriculariae]|uniref:TLC domain-containing protein n=1 Tax=Caenorhabditis auriculariae TaxID=2777116 RepID=A0A8S1H3F4_9PELO|nr:unnamed protein product [Caenorhabditis auriculariae]